MKAKKLLCRLSFLISQSSFSLPPLCRLPPLHWYTFTSTDNTPEIAQCSPTNCKHAVLFTFFSAPFSTRWRSCDRRKQELWKCLINERKRQAISDDERRKIRSQSNDLGGGMKMMMKMKLQREKLTIENSMMIRNHFPFLRSSIPRCRRFTAPDSHPQSF